MKMKKETNVLGLPEDYYHGKFTVELWEDILRAGGMGKWYDKIMKKMLK